jgi:hypothetical protein
MSKPLTLTKKLTFKCELAFIVHAEVKCQLALGRPNVTQDVVVCLPFKQLVAYLGVSVVRCVVQC